MLLSVMVVCMAPVNSCKSQPIFPKEGWESRGAVGGVELVVLAAYVCFEWDHTYNTKSSLLMLGSVPPSTPGIWRDHRSRTQDAQPT